MDMRSVDRSELRVRLLATWMQALFDGYLMGAVPLNRSEREATVEWLSALACIGLLRDTIVVKYEDYYKSGPPNQLEMSQRPKYPEIDGRIQSFVDEKLPGRHLDIRLAVAWGARLNLVEARDDGLRFPHSIRQAYLASRFMSTALQDSKIQQDAAARLRSPGREFLIALVLYARSVDTDREGRSADRPLTASSTSAFGSDVRSIRDVLITSATDARDDVKKLELYAAALEIDSFLDESRHEEIARRVADDWGHIRGWVQRTLDEAKLGLVSRFGDAVRTVADRPARGLRKLNPAYGELFEMARGELSYPIRLAIAQEIGAGGDEAFRVLRQSSHNAPGNTWKNAAWPNVTEPVNGRSGNTDNNRALRGRALCAWLTPLLVGSVNEYSEEARQELAHWLERVGRDQEGDGNYFHLSLEVALAQGFKYAANRRLRHPHAFPAVRDYLAEQALEMLKWARFWFTQLTLIHALCLWEMPDPSMSQDDKTGRRSNGSNAAENQAHQHGWNPKATVGHWLEVAGNGTHPFVAEAGKLAVQALKTGQPERFLWIDESGIVSSVGSRASPGTNDRKHHLWIPPSAGWTALDPRAQQLVADVLLLLNLVERGGGPEQIERRLRRVEGNDLPLCFTRNRDPLDPKTAAGGLFQAPGSNCIDGCRHQLCPYPPYGSQPYRSELSEAFCQGQQTLVSRGLSAPWQTIPRANLRHFWEQMTGRADGASTDHDLD